MNDWLMLAFGVLLTLGTGVFVASEFSLVNLERSELEARAERGETGLSRSIRALKATSTHLSSAQLGITLTTMLTGFLAGTGLATALALATGFTGALAAGFFGLATTLALALGAAALAAFLAGVFTSCLLAVLRGRPQPPAIEWQMIRGPVHLHG